MRIKLISIIFIAIISAALTFQSSVNIYLSLLKTGSIKFYLSFIFFGILTYILAKLKSKKPLIFLFGILISILGFLTNYFSVIITIIYYLLILAIGFIICNKLNIKNSFISILTIGYSLFSFVFNIPYLNNNIPIKEYYYLVLVLSTVLVYLNRKNLRTINIKNFVDPELIFDPKVILLIIVYLYAACITSFMWDDINAYLYFPLQSLIENRSILSPEMPGSLTFQSLHSLSFTTALGIWSNYDYSIVYFYKFFNLCSYVLALIALWDVLKKIFNNHNYTKLTFFIISTSCIWFIQITSNYTDFPIFLLTIYCLHLLNKSNSIDSKILDLIDYIIFGLFVSITLKSLVIILPFIAQDFIRSVLIKKVNLKLLIIPLFILPSLLRNFIYSGNPTFPAANNIWKSTYFSTDPSSIVVSKFWPSTQIDLSLFVNFLTISESSLRNFYSSLAIFYSPLFYFLFSFSVLLFLFKYINLVSNRFLILGIVTFFLTIYLPGAQHRYFISSYSFILIGIIYIFYSSKFININHKFLNIIIYFLIVLFPLSPYVSNQVHYRNHALFSNGLRDWNEKIIFYEKVNKYFSLRDDRPKILLHYIQDKLFLKGVQSIEYDWYDYTSIKELIDIMGRNNNNADQIKLAQHFLCRNNFNYVILSNESQFRSLKLRKIQDGIQQSLYEIECIN